MEDSVHRPIRLSRADSTASEITGDRRSSDSAEHQAESQRMESTPTEWTDEKHSLYLKSMEASFVDQLYNTSDLNNLRSQKDGSSDSITSRKMHTNSYIPSGQFKVLQGGCWSKVNFKRDESQSIKGTQSRALPANPWIRHFRTGSKQVPPSQKNYKSFASQQVITSHKHLCQRDQNACNTEASGQNFPDEDVASEKTSELNSMKRMRTTVVASSSNDQVVPLGILPMTVDVAKNHASMKK